MHPAEALFHQHRAEIPQMAHRHRVKNVRIFGSVQRGETTAESDLDLLVDLEPDGGLFDLIGLKQELEDLIGCRVDLLTTGSLSPHLRDRILAEAVPL